MSLTIESLEQMVADLAANAPPKKTVFVHGNTAYLFDDIPDPYFIPLEPPRFKPEPDDLHMSALYGWQILSPEKFASVVTFDMAIPDARPVCLSREQMLTIPLRKIRRLQGYVTYARAKRIRRENRA